MLLPSHVCPAACTLFQHITKGPEVFDICDGTRRLEGNTLQPPKEINAMLLLDGHLKVCEVDTNFLLSNNTCMWASDTVRYCEVIHTKARIQNTGTHPLHAFHRVALLDVCRSSVLLLVATVEQIQLTPSMHACPLFQFANDLTSGNQRDLDKTLYTFILSCHFNNGNL